jgi:hypothetical protein
MTLVTLRLQGNKAAWCQEIVELEKLAVFFFQAVALRAEARLI